MDNASYIYITIKNEKNLSLFMQKKKNKETFKKNYLYNTNISQ